MQYKILKMHFKTSVHFGSGNLHKSQYVVYADTIFSALCIEAVKRGTKTLQDLVNAVRQNHLRISDGLPYIGEDLYLPKPMMEISAEQRGDSIVKKAMKKLEYLPAEKFSDYLAGRLDVGAEEKYFRQNLGRSGLMTKTSIGAEETTPYNVGIFTYGSDSGLYLIIAYESEKDFSMLCDLFESLTYAGLGGKISAGLGKFDMVILPVLADLGQKLSEGEKTKYSKMSLSVSLPTEKELETAVDGADYKVIKRSGFVASGTYGENTGKKKDLYVFTAGSVFRKAFEGDVYDVSDHGRHPVYRYAKPMFMEVRPCSLS